MKLGKGTKGVIGAGLLSLILALLSMGPILAEAPIDVNAAKAPALEITFIDVKQGDSILVKSPDGKFMLIDAGEYKNVNAVMEALKANNVSRLEYVVSTHPHSDHVGGLSKVIRDIPVGTVYDIGRVHTTSSYQFFLDAIKGSSAKFVKIRAGGTFKLGAFVNVSFLWPYQDMPSDLNDASAVLLMRYNSFDALFTADVGIESELVMLKNSKIPPVELLKVSHHGSRHASSSEFLKAASAELAVITVGAGNDYGYPQDAALVRIKASGAKILRTDLDGSIKVSSDGTKWWASTSKGTTISSSTTIPAASNSSVQVSATYVGSAGSTVFHLSSCEAVLTISKANLVTYLNREDAISKGKRPCKICNP